MQLRKLQYPFDTMVLRRPLSKSVEFCIENLLSTLSYKIARCFFSVQNYMLVSNNVHFAVFHAARTAQCNDGGCIKVSTGKVFDCFVLKLIYFDFHHASEKKKN